MIRVYIAGPYSSNPVQGTRNAIGVATRLWREGYVPYVPHLTLLWDFLTPLPYQDWLDYDNQWLPLCHVVLRLAGESSGADKEVALAESLGKPVVYSLEGLRLEFPVGPRQVAGEEHA